MRPRRARRSRAGLAILLGTLVVPASAVTAAADVLCLRKSGAVMVRAACRGREVVLAPGEVGLVAPSGPAGAPGTAGPEGLLPFEILDARGAPVGLVASVTGSLVLLEHAALVRPVLFEVVPEGFHDEGQGRVYHELSGCSGGAGLRAGSAITGLVPIALLMGPVAFYETGPLGTFASSSYEEACEAGETPSTPRGTCCHEFALTLPDVFPASRVELPTLGFEPPFRMVLR